MALYINGFPDGNNIGSTVHHVGEKPNVILYNYYIDRPCRDTRKNRTNKTETTSYTPSHMVVIIYMGYKLLSCTYIIDTIRGR